MSRPLNVLSLFAGIGGLELGLERAGMTTVGQVEINEYCRRVLAKHWPDVPRHDDVRTAMDWWTGERRPRVDVICGGFPCQDISVAGRRAGIIDGSRSSLWTYMAHAVRILRPSYVLVENVPRVLNRGRDGVIPAEVVAADLATIGYDLRWDCIPASALGAPHRRDRWFGIAHTDSDALRVESVGQRRGCGEGITDLDGGEQLVADADSSGLERDRLRRPTTECGRGEGSVPDAASQRRRQGRQGRPVGRGAYWARVWPQALAHSERRAEHSWAAEPHVGRVVNGIPTRVDRATEDNRIRALGNAVVPQVAEHIGRLILAHHCALSASGVSHEGQQK